jgi:adapter protein MecA 1/2
MKIEKINEKQIRCHLTRSELENRDLTLGKLLMGSGNSRVLLHDLIKQASDECEFNIDDDPLMIEATPISHNELVLKVTKLDAEEEDTENSDEPLLRETERKRVFASDDISSLIEAASAVGASFGGISDLYRSRTEHKYYLLLGQGSCDSREYNRVSLVLTDYTKLMTSYAGQEEFISGHCRLLLKNDALRVLKKLTVKVV